jgi:hypothetical protein
MAIPLTAARAPAEFRPPALYPKDKDGHFKKRPHDVIILIRVPTMYERDSFASALVRGGVVHHGPKQIRALLLAGVQVLYPTEQFDAIRADLEELWAVTDEEQKVQQLQTERLVELLDVEPGTKPPPQKKIEEELNKIVAEVKMDPAKRIRVFAQQQHVMASYEPLQAVFADLAEQDARRSWLQAEVYVTGWRVENRVDEADTVLQHQPEGNGLGGLKKHEAEYLRREIGQDAWMEISEFITALHGLDGDEEKNLASLLVSMSAQIGSTQTESKASSGNGASTDGPISQTRGGGSRKTTASSSNSSKPSVTKKAKSGPGPTAKASSTSQ